MHMLLLFQPVCALGANELPTMQERSGGAGAVSCCSSAIRCVILIMSYTAIHIGNVF